MRYIHLVLIALVAISISEGCRTTKNSSKFQKKIISTQNSALQINLQSPINSMISSELKEEIYRDQSYFLLQNKENQFKDNAPFVEYLDGGQRERLWFSSSRADSLFFGAKNTNFYQQIYFCERTVGEGKCPGEGWSAPKLFAIENSTGNPLVDAFNRATKGTVAIANNTMIVSCDQLNSANNSEFKQLWVLDIVDGKIQNPRPLYPSGEEVWDAQPTLSPDGKHLFFVSNREPQKAISQNKDLNIFYSYCDNGNWTSPVVVTELSTPKNEITPQIGAKANKLLFSSDKDGDFDLFEVDLKLNGGAYGYTINAASMKKYEPMLMDLCSSKKETFKANDKYHQKYPFHYYNPVNTKVPQALFWASDDPKGLGSYDIYACAMPFKLDVQIKLVDLCQQGGNQQVEFPVIELSGASKITENADEAHFKLLSGLEYRIAAGSYACKEKGTYYCDRDDKFIFIGYSKLNNKLKPDDKQAHRQVISGAVVESELNERLNNPSRFNITSDTLLYDTIFITKAWEPKPACPEVLDIPQKHHAIAYFQSGFWEVNTTANLKRDLALMHDGFELTPVNDIYNPQGIIKPLRSGYKAFEWETPISPINLKDKRTYSIADARWIELHPYNFYWGDRPDYRSNLAARMKGRKARIEQYIDYAKKVDENLQMLTDTVKNRYIDFLELHKDAKPKLLIEIFAVSDQREVLRGWYIGDTIKYRGSSYLGNNEFTYEPVKIIPPKVDEATKTLVEIKPCSIELNAEGNNGCVLGINNSKTEMNTNLSRLRAWFGYKEVFNRLIESENFRKYLDAGLVALPDNDVPYSDANIIILTQGRRIDIIDPKSPFPDANNPNGQGFYDFDQIRRVEIRIRLLIDKQEVKVKDYCCTPNGK
jgi:hypothetical protein